MSEEKHGPFTIRRDEDGNIDEVFAEFGAVAFHMEAMSDSSFWFALTTPSCGHLHMNVGARKAPVRLTLQQFDPPCPRG